MTGAFLFFEARTTRQSHAARFTRGPGEKVAVSTLKRAAFQPAYGAGCMAGLTSGIRDARAVDKKAPSSADEIRCTSVAHFPRQVIIIQTFERTLLDPSTIGPSSTRHTVRIRNRGALNRPHPGVAHGDGARDAERAVIEVVHLVAGVLAIRTPHGVGRKRGCAV